jgi:electron transport complex protein RnfE
MSAGVVFVLVLSGFCASLLARWGGKEVGALRSGASARRWVGALAITSCLTASFEIVLLAVSPEASAALGIYAPLIAVNCLVLGHFDSASRASLGSSLVDSLGKGMGFAALLLVIALIREVLGAGTITIFPMGSFSGVVAIPGLFDDPARAFGLSGAGLLCIGYLAAVAQGLRRRRERRDGAKLPGDTPAEAS